jgi:hypothetical protein
VDFESSSKLILEKLFESHRASRFISFLSTFLNFSDFDSLARIDQKKILLFELSKNQQNFSMHFFHEEFEHLKARIFMK